LSQKEDHGASARVSVEKIQRESEKGSQHHSTERRCERKPMVPSPNRGLKKGLMNQSQQEN